MAYLESSNPRNIPLYERHGFEALGEIQVGFAGGSSHPGVAVAPSKGLQLATDSWASLKLVGFWRRDPVA